MRSTISAAKDAGNSIFLLSVIFGKQRGRFSDCALETPSKAKQAAAGDGLIFESFQSVPVLNYIA
jgi:hypothetical protein